MDEKIQFFFCKDDTLFKISLCHRKLLLMTWLFCSDVNCGKDKLTAFAKKDANIKQDPIKNK